MASIGTKHLVECNCILPQFVKRNDPPFHKFTVFSSTDETGTQVIPKLVQCPNCAVIHKVTDYCKSEILSRREKSVALVTPDDIKLSLPPELVAVLEKNHVDLPTWEQAQFIVENERWGDFIIFTSETVDGTRSGKILRIIGRSIFKIEPFSYTNIVEQT